MAFARMFDLLPVVFNNVLHLAKGPAEDVLSSRCANLQEIYTVGETSWVRYFTSWGEVSVASIHRRWKEASFSILKKLKEMCCFSESLSNLFEEIQCWLMTGILYSTQL
jgi:hypothetical protein